MTRHATDIMICPRCSGTGWMGHPDDPAGKCSVCWGSGGVVPMVVRDTTVPAHLFLSADDMKELAAAQSDACHAGMVFFSVTKDGVKRIPL